MKITIPSSKYELTQKGVGNDTQINSKFEVEAKETDEITKLDSADLPQLVVSNVNAGLVKRETKVIVNYKEDGTIKITENIDYVFRRSIRQLELAGITQPIIGIKKRTIK